MTIHNKHSNEDPVLANRIAEESQLRAEQQWLVSALNSIKAQRNSLQIERLHMESMRAKMLMNLESEQQKSLPPATRTPLAKEFMQAALSSSRNNESDDDEFVCNQETLDLGVAKNALNNPFPPVADESGEDDDSDVSADDVYIDMNMLMSTVDEDNDTVDESLDDYLL